MLPNGLLWLLLLLLLLLLRLLGLLLMLRGSGGGDCCGGGGGGGGGGTQLVAWVALPSSLSARFLLSSKCLFAGGRAGRPAAR